MVPIFSLFRGVPFPPEHFEADFPRREGPVFYKRILHFEIRAILSFYVSFYFPSLRAAKILFQEGTPRNIEHIILIDYYIFFDFQRTGTCGWGLHLSSETH